MISYLLGRKHNCLGILTGSYFYAVFSKPCIYLVHGYCSENNEQIPVCKMLLHFETAKDEQVLAKFSISSVDAEGAYKTSVLRCLVGILMEC